MRALVSRSFRSGAEMVKTRLSMPTVDLPLPLPDALRRRIALELAALAVLTPIFLYFAPHDLGLYATLALLFLGFILITARNTKEYVWGRHEAHWFVRLRRSARPMSLLTIPPVAAFFAWCVWTGHHISWLNLFLAFCLYLPWALLQQTIFQVYLLGRLRAVLPLTPPILIAAFNGTAYGLVHLPDQGLALVTVVAGILWSYTYLRDRHLLPIAVSHAMLGSTFYYFVGARDLFAEWVVRLNG